MRQMTRKGKRIVPGEPQPLTKAELDTLAMGAMSETTFDSHIERAAATFGVWSYHAPKNVRRCGRCGQYVRTASRAGWPDRTYILRSGRFIFRELKTTKGDLETEQAEVLARMRAAGMDAKVWRPTDWDEIVETLKEGLEL